MIDEIKTNLTQAVEHLQEEIKGLRTGRANPSLVENIAVNVYGSDMPMNQVANISTPDASSIVIEPWDKNVMQEVEKAIKESDIGLNPANEGERIRISLPPMTEERRDELEKVVNDKVEEAKISIRNTREGALKKLKDADESEDEEERMKEEIQKEVDSANTEIEKIGDTKKEEVRSIG
ncbi:ribosome recycling factor [Patescibacteria group bacterium]